MENVQNEQRMTKMETEIGQIKDLLIELKEDIRGMNKTFVPRSEITLMFEHRDKTIQALKTDIDDRKRNIPNWISSIVAIVAVVVAYFK